MDIKRYGVWATPKTAGVEPDWHTQHVPTVVHSMEEARELAQRAYVNNDHWLFEPRELPPTVPGITAEMARDITYDAWSAIRKELRGRIGEIEAALAVAEAQRDTFEQKAKQLQDQLNEGRGTARPRWRIEVVAFADAMERKLRENDHKGHWDDCQVEYLLRRLREETKELATVAGDRDARSLTNEEEAAVVNEAADVANFAMMVADVCGGLMSGLECHPDDEVPRLRQRVADVAEELRKEQEQAAELRAKLKAATAGPDDVWYWTGAGDEPGSLTCPVVMLPEQLRAFVAAADAGRKVGAAFKPVGAALYLEVSGIEAEAHVKELQAAIAAIDRAP
jgi:hypothetical protein